MGWSLSTLLSHLHEGIQHDLGVARTGIVHSGTKGDASEQVWIDMFNNYLPQRYKAAKAHVVDSKGNFSQQIDIVVFDRQYSPFIFQFGDQIFVPAESIYAVFEVKQTINVQLLKYAGEKVASVRRLHRTSLPIPHAGGEYPAKPPMPIVGGVLSLESDWSPALGEPLREGLRTLEPDSRLDCGCIAAHGHFFIERGADEPHKLFPGSKPATAFLFRLISQLQYSGTVPMIDVMAYADWLEK